MTKNSSANVNTEVIEQATEVAQVKVQAPKTEAEKLRAILREVENARKVADRADDKAAAAKVALEEALAKLTNAANSFRQGAPIVTNPVNETVVVQEAVGDPTSDHQEVEYGEVV